MQVYDPPMCCSTGALAVLLLLTALLSEGCGKQKPTGTITIDGSDTVYPLSKALADAFHQSNPGVQFDTRFSGTGAGFRKFCAGQVDIQGASRPINAAEGEQCKASHVDYIELAVAVDSLTVVVNPQNSFVRLPHPSGIEDHLGASGRGQGEQLAASARWLSLTTHDALRSREGLGDV